MNMEMNNRTNEDYMLRNALRRTEVPSDELLTKTIKERPAVRAYNRGRKLAVAAVVAVTLLALSTVALATNMFGLRDTVIPGTDATLTHEWQDGTVVEYTQQLISLQGFSGSPEHAAAVEWQEFLNSYDEEAALALVGNAWIGDIPEHYRFYGAFSFEMANKINEILDKYDLVMLGNLMDINVNTPEEFREYFQTNLAHGYLFTDDSISFNGYVYENGTFRFDAHYGEILFQMGASRKGVFDNVFLNIGDLDDFTEWNYKNAHGSQLVLTQSEYQSLILLETEAFFISVNILAGTDGNSWLPSTPSFGRSNLEYFADLIDFGQIRNDLPDLVRHEFPGLITSERLESERNQLLAIRTELDAERSERLAIIADFIGMWVYVGSESDDGAALPMFYRDGLMIDEYLRAFFFSGEGVLEQHLRLENPEPKPEYRFFIGKLTPIGTGEFEVENSGHWNYTDEEISYSVANWDMMRLRYDPTSEQMRFTDWLGVHHFYERES